MGHGRNDSGRLNPPNPWDGGENLALARLLNTSANLGVQLLNMLLQHAQFSNELALFQDQTPLADHLFGANPLSCHLLLLLQLPQPAAPLPPHANHIAESS